MCVYVTHMAVGYNIVSNNEKLGAECLLIEVWKNKLQHFHTMEYFLVKRYTCTDMQRYSKHLVKFEKAAVRTIQSSYYF